MSSPSEDLGALYAEREAELQREELLRWAQARMGAAPTTGEPQAPENPTPQLEDPSSPRPPQGEGVSAGDVAKDIGGGVIGSPREMLGGVIDALRNTSKLMNPGDIPGAETPLAQQVLPEIEGTGTVTGGIVRGISQFLVPFTIAGKATAIQRLAQLGTAGRITAPMLQGAIADVTAFDPDAGRLSNLVQQFPALQNPVTEYLAAQPDDSDAEGRFKNALEGLAIGGLTDAFAKAVRTVRAMRTAKAAAGLDDAAVRQAVEVAGAQQGRMTELLGDPSARPLRVVASEAAPDAPGEVFINWSRIEAPDDVKQIVQDLANAKAGSIDEARRGVRSWEATRLSAQQADAWEILQGRKKGQPLNAEESLAVRELWVRSGAQVRTLAEQVRRDPGDLNRIALRRQLAVHNAVQEQVIAARTETARALNAWRIPAGDAAEFAGQMDQLRELVRSDTDIDLIAQKLGELTDAGLEKEAETFIQGTRRAKGAAMIRQLFYFSRLSSPFTHVRNFLGNTAAIPLQMLESKGANLIGKALGTRATSDGETLARGFGYLQGVQRALRTSAKGQEIFAAASKLALSDPAGARALLLENADQFSPVARAAATGQSGFGIGKVADAQRGAFDPSVFGVDPTTVLGRTLKWFDLVTTSPTRALTTSDELFKTMAYDAELSALSWRKAADEVATGRIPRERFNDRVAELLTDPDEYLQLASQRSAEVQTFSQQPQNTKAWRAWSGVADVPVIGRLTIPFRRTPFNIATFTFQRTPLAPFVKSWREDIFAGGARAEMAWSKFVVGNSLLLVSADLAMNGHITGEGPADYRERETLARGGWKPNAVRIRTGGTNKDPTYRYFSYRGLEPIATSLGIAANTVDILRYQDWEDADRDTEELAIAASMSIASQVTSQSYMSSMASLFDALSDPQRYGENYWERLLTIPIPLAVSQVARTTDPTVRMTETLIDSLKAGIPGLSKTLPAQRDLWGRPISRASGLGDFYDAVSPIYSSSTENAQPIDRELNRLELWIGKPQKELNFGGAKLSLRNRPEIHSRYVELAGNATKIDGMGLMDTLNALVSGKHENSPDYASLTDGPDGSKALFIEQYVRSFREAAKFELLEEYPELRAELEQRAAERAAALSPAP